MAGTNVLRGEVRVCNLERHGGLLWKDRPVLVVQNDKGNLYSPDTIVLAIRSAQEERRLPICVKAMRGIGGLAKDSIIDAGHILTVPKDSLGARIGAMPPEAMAAGDLPLRISLVL